MQTGNEDTSEFTLQIQLFGALDVRLNGVPIPPLRSRKVQWLLALLLLRQGQSLDRSWLAGAFWPDSTPKQSLYNLRQGLTNIRHALGDAKQCLRASMVNALSMEIGLAEMDVLQFDAAVSAVGDSAALERAVALYRGPLLEGCTEEWVFAERRVREENYLSALETLAGRALERGEGSAAVKYLRAAILVDPLREQAQRTLIQILAGMGDYGAAVQVYRDLRLVLRREVNADPDPETQAVFQQVRATAQTSLQRLPTTVVPLPSHDPPPVSVRRLPCPLTTLVGRNQEREQLSVLLSTARLLTLTGSGGVGKTRLAIAVAEQAAEEYADGGCFVDLAPLSDPALLAQTVAMALQVREEPDTPLLATLQTHLQSKALLLLLDNCEHLLDACADLTDTILRNCPGVRILATSRQHLGLTGEVNWKVASLSTPAFSDLADRNRPSQKDRMSLLSEYEAVQLFVIRAQQASSSFQMTSRNAETIARICTHLDGLPLALELAAARVRSLPVEEIYSKIQDRFRLLTGGSRTALPRQKTLRALLDWSYDLLNESEKALLGRLSVFAGGWTLHAAEEVCTEEELGEEAPFEAWEVVDLLSSLVDKSLVMVDQEAGQMRYRLLETMRQYAQDRLQERGEVERVRRRHQDFFVALAEEAEPHLKGPQQTLWLHRLEADHDNLRQALLTGGSQEAALRIAGALWRYMQVKSYYREGREWLAAALAGAEVQGGTLARTKALHGAGGLACSQGDYAAAQTLHEESMALCRDLKDAQGIADALQSLGNIAAEQGNYTEARAWFSEGLDLRRELGDRHGIAILLNNLANVISDQGDLMAAKTLQEESLSLRRELGDKAGIASSLNNLGNSTWDQGDPVTARAYFSESLGLHRELGNRVGIATALHNLGGIAHQQDDVATARLFYLESLSLYREVGFKRGLAYTLEVLGTLALSDEQVRRATHLFCAAAALRAAIDAPLPPADQEKHDYLLAQVGALLGEESFAVACSEGSSLTLEQAVEYALGGPLA